MSKNSAPNTTTAVARNSSSAPQCQDCRLVQEGDRLVGRHWDLFWSEVCLFFRYKAVIDACSLQPDIDLLPFGDQTEIGERVCTHFIYCQINPEMLGSLSILQRRDICELSVTYFWYNTDIFSHHVLLWFRASTWVEVRDRESVWPELSTRTPTSSSWWALRYWWLSLSCFLISVTH